MCKDVAESVAGCTGWASADRISANAVEEMVMLMLEAEVVFVAEVVALVLAEAVVVKSSSRTVNVGKPLSAYIMFRIRTNSLVFVPAIISAVRMSPIMTLWFLLGSSIWCGEGWLVDSAE